MANKPAAVQEKDNLLDYIYKFGMFSFAQLPFTLNDSLVFSAIAYLSFEDVSLKEGDSVNSLCCKLTGRFNYREKMLPFKRSLTYLIMALISSERYSHFIIKKAYSYLSKEKKIQYASLAMAYKDTLIVSFRGTDNTIIGWHEDFNLACYNSLYSQDIAADFLKESIDSGRYKNVYVCGHSKGGNLALASACKIDKKYQKKITNVFPIDAPGLSESMFKSEGRERIKDKVVTIVPVDSFIGTLLLTEKASHVVKAYPKNDIFAQHSVFALETMETGLYDVEDRSPLSYYVEDSVEEFLSTTLATFDERREFVDEVFSVIDAMEFKNFDEIFKNPTSFVTKFLFLNGDKYDSQKKKKLLSTLKEFIGCFTKRLPKFKKDNEEFQKKFWGKDE